MEVIRSKNAGACYGVQRALDLALKASEGDGSAFTLGPLIHNPQVVANLEARGVLAVSRNPSRQRTGPSSSAAMASPRQCAARWRRAGFP